MKLKEAFYCPECQEVFNYAEHQTVCPSCANRYAFSLQRIWFSQPKGVQNEDIKINRVFVTPARYDVCRAATGKDDYSSFETERIDRNSNEAPDFRNQFKRDRPVRRFGISTIRNIAKLFNCVDVHRKCRKQESDFKSKLQRFDANTLSRLLRRC